MLPDTRVSPEGQAAGARWVHGQTCLAEKFSSVPRPAGWLWWSWGLRARSSFSDQRSTCFLAPWILRLLLSWEAKLRNHLLPLLWVLAADGVVKETFSALSWVAEGTHRAGNPSHVSQGQLQHLGLHARSAKPWLVCCIFSAAGM